MSTSNPHSPASGPVGLRGALVLCVAVILLGVLALAGLVIGTDDDGGGPDAAATTGPPVSVFAIDNSFDPDEATVAVGTLVVWENRGRNEHDIVPEDPAAPWAVPVEDFAPGSTSEYRFTEPGTYRYFCSIHGNIDIGMPGVIIVE